MEGTEENWDRGKSDSSKCGKSSLSPARQTVNMTRSSRKAAKKSADKYGKLLLPHLTCPYRDRDFSEIITLSLSEREQSKL
jgi:hypothetical protein